MPAYGLQERLASKIVVDANLHWLWSGRLNRDGYGEVTISGKRWMIHRYFYTYFVEEIPKGLVIDHLCRIRNCVNPDHLEPVTHAENVKRGERATRQECKRGHEYNSENTRIDPATSSRVCRVCDREEYR